MKKNIKEIFQRFDETDFNQKEFKHWLELGYDLGITEFNWYSFILGLLIGTNIVLLILL